jgi:biopolymer transport protein ExbD
MPFILRSDPISLFPRTSGIIETFPGNGPKIWSPRAGRDERIRKRRSQYHCQIDVSALLAIFFVLLIIFMMSSGSHHEWQWLAVDLPKSEHSSWLPAARREDAMRLAVYRDGQLAFNKRRVSPDQLPGKIHEALQDGAENRIYLYADARGRYGFVKEVLATVRLAGVQHVSFVTESRLQ